MISSTLLFLILSPTLTSLGYLLFCFDFFNIIYPLDISDCIDIDRGLRTKVSEVSLSLFVHRASIAPYIISLIVIYSYSRSVVADYCTFAS